MFSPRSVSSGEKLVTIIDGTTTINYDPTTKAGTKLLHTLELLGGEEKFKGKSMAAMGEEMYTNMGGKKTGTKTVAGLSCDVWKIDKLGTESCIHKGITLEVTTELVGMNKGMSTLQFQSLSVSPHDVNMLQGGTQDNGTWENKGQRSLWVNTMIGDGGQSGFDAANPAFRFHTFFNATPDVNFDNGDIAGHEAIGRGLRDIEMVDGVVTRGEIPRPIGSIVFIELPIGNNILQA